jgi:hypothetical protein
MKERKNIQEGNWRTYMTQKEQLKEEIDENQGVDIQEGMLKDRRDWITNHKENNNNKIPDDIKPFHARFAVESALSPEEEEAKKAAEDEGGGKKGKKEAKKEKGKKGKGKKGKGGGGGEDGDVAIIKIGTSEVVQKFDEHYDAYNDVWVQRDETDNYKQQHDVELAKHEIMPILEEEYKK